MKTHTQLKYIMYSLIFDIYNFTYKILFKILFKILLNILLQYIWIYILITKCFLEKYVRVRIVLVECKITSKVSHFQEGQIIRVKTTCIDYNVKNLLKSNIDACENVK